MRILVSGGQGQVGTALAAMGVERGWDLIALGRSEFDVTDVTSISEAFKKYQPGLLINAAAYTAVDQAESEEKLAYAINEMATALLANACREAKIPMLHISTDYVFDGDKDELYTEEDQVNPLAVYAKSKEAGERALRAGLERYIILRTSWVFGLYGTNFVKTMLRAAKIHGQLRVVDDQVGGPSSAQGIAAALFGIAARYEQTGDVAWGTYHYCQKPYVSWYRFAQVIIEQATQMGLLDHDVEVLPIPSSAFPTPVSRPKNSRLCTSHFESTFRHECGNWIDELQNILRAFV